MLITCPECNKEVSDSAPSCPHCGYVLKATVIDATSNETGSISHKKIAIFQFISMGAIVIALFTPRILVTLPCLVIISTGIIALVRKEPRWLLSVISIVLGFVVISTASSDFSNDKSYIPNMEIQKDISVERDYIYIKGRVKNIGDKTVSYFKIKAYYKDQSGNVLDTDYTNNGEDLLPGMSKEFEIMHKKSDDYKDIDVFLEELRTK